MSRQVPISEERAQQMMAKQQAQEEQQERFTEQKDSMMRAFVSAEGRDRLKRIEQVKPERSQQVEMYIIQAVQQGKLTPPVSDDTVRDLLGKLSEQSTAKSSNITIVRKRTDDDW
ncbi:programmed cell death protein 5 [Angomonas deanei]|uniref:Double-stranded DNA-binding domain containing protein, putative n=1 Tax=Angomonas deanei TaxID=59799 RepID=S9VAE5_9TRYP|nr:programmed cell death protein 5 [Angomonas deanei]EPY39057.1 programmed cell death protein 5 [Angomonas deanei]EPY39957.1 programmed cell death protein 5 [Angomonas deanei]CAD2218825.1 Double-stranded DNA-binding domain containing protein, putative [Angomonas deanei]|eukprot:EPY24354.1 programmed cell death protein 5 [Angomonas deanei]